MQGQKQFGGKLFYQVSLEELVPADHILRRFESILSLDFLHSETKAYYSHTWQPSIDPVVLFKMMLLGYLFGISSERHLAREIQVNLAYRWYLGYDLDEATPNHSVLSKARRRFPEAVFARVFEHVVRLCAQAGLIGGEALCLDSTLIRANAAIDSFVAIKEAPEDFVQRVYQENGLADDEPIAKDGTMGRHYDGQADPRKMGRRRKRSFVNSRLRSRTDPEAALVFRRSTGRQAAFKGHLAVDGDHQIITAVAVSPGSADDTTAVSALLHDHRAAVGNGPQSVVADSHYGTSEVYEYLAGQGIEAVVRPRRVNNRPGYFTIADFRYDREQDHYVCPQGEILRLKGYQRTVHRKAYVANQEACERCPCREQCTTSRQQGRLLTRFIDDHFERADAVVGSERGKYLLRRRQVVIEGVFGEAKSQHLLGRALFRGLRKLKTQVLLTAIVLNLKRLLQTFPKAASRELVAAIRGESGCVGPFYLLFASRRPSLALA